MKVAAPQFVESKYCKPVGFGYIGSHTLRIPVYEIVELYRQFLKQAIKIDRRRNRLPCQRTACGRGMEKGEILEKGMPGIIVYGACHTRKVLECFSLLIDASAVEALADDAFQTEIKVAVPIGASYLSGAYRRKSVFDLPFDQFCHSFVESLCIYPVVDFSGFQILFCFQQRVRRQEAAYYVVFHLQRFVYRLSVVIVLRHKGMQFFWVKSKNYGNFSLIRSFSAG